MKVCCLVAPAAELELDPKSFPKELSIPSARERIISTKCLDTRTENLTKKNALEVELQNL